MFVGPPVICLEITRFESAKLTSDTLVFGNLAKIPDFSRFKTAGILILNGDVLEPVVVVPVLIPATLVVAAKVNTLPSLDIFVTLLKVGKSKSPLEYEMIDPVLRPTFPAKLRLDTLAAVPTTFN